jgi:hypothetical protein
LREIPLAKYCNTVKPNTIYILIKAAREIIKNIALPDQEQARKEAIAHYKKLIKKSHKYNALSEARQNQARLDKINGIETENVNINHSGALIIDDKQRDKRIEELEQKMKQSRLLQKRKKKNT